MREVNAEARVRLRAPEERDVAVLARLRRDRTLQHVLLAYPPEQSPSDADVAAWIARRVSDPDGAMLVVADENDQPVGFVQITEVSRSGRHGRFGIAILPQERGRGYGKAALEALLSHARSAMLLRKLLLDVRTDNQRAIALYESLGFVRVGVLRAHYQEGPRQHDVLIMERMLDDGAP